MTQKHRCIIRDSTDSLYVDGADATTGTQALLDPRRVVLNADRVKSKVQGNQSAHALCLTNLHG